MTLTEELFSLIRAFEQESGTGLERNKGWLDSNEEAEWQKTGLGEH